MATAFHRDQAAADGIHTPFAAVYADAAARTAATHFSGKAVFDTNDLYKAVLQLDSGAIYVLTATTPTWTLVSAGGTGGAVGAWANARTKSSGGFDWLQLKDSVTGKYRTLFLEDGRLVQGEEEA